MCRNGGRHGGNEVRKRSLLNPCHGTGWHPAVTRARRASASVFRENGKQRPSALCGEVALVFPNMTGWQALRVCSAARAAVPTRVQVRRHGALEGVVQRTYRGATSPRFVRDTLFSKAHEIAHS